MKYAWSVKMFRYGRNGEHWDTTEYNAVIASSIKDACRIGLRQAIEDSGFKSKWVVISATRGDWVVT